MKSICKEVIHETVIKKSRFICYMKKIESEEEAKEYVASLKKMHHGANHHCSAYKVGNIDRANDDGEPSQTAGMPMLNVLNHNELENTIAVVVRYFGGTKLGAGGLVRAYGSSVSNALEVADIATLIPGKKTQIECSYSDVDKINYILKCLNVSALDIKYEQKVTYTIECSDAITDEATSQINDYNHLIKLVTIKVVYVVDVPTEK